MTFNQLQYMKKRYHSDPEFRQRMIASSAKWQRRNRKHVNEMERERYANRTPKQIKSRKDYLRKLRGYSK